MIIRRRIRLLVAIAAACAIAFPVTIAPAAAPRLDREFGVGGVARTAFPPKAAIEPFREAAEAPDGGVIVRSGFGEEAELRHYGPDGRLVNIASGAEEGRKVFPPPPEASIADSGRLVGVRLDEGSGAVSRYLPDGSPDDSFGDRGTSEKVPFAIDAVAALPSGAVLAAGEGILRPVGTHSEATYQVYVARWGPDGKIDQAFGRSGIVKLHTEDDVVDAQALYIQARGDGGAEIVTGSEAVALDRSGALDPSFAGDGRLTMSGGLVGATAAPDEGLLVAGAGPVSPNGDRGGFYVARYTAAGVLDPTYAGGAGMAVVEPQEVAAARAVLFEADGSVLIGGLLARRSDCPSGYSCGVTPTVVRFTAGGSGDTGFGREGIVKLSALTVPYETDFPSGVEALAPRPDGGVFAAGAGLSAPFVAALGADGSLDSGFDGDGLVTTAATETSYATPSAIGVDRTGGVYTLVQSDSGTGLTSGAFVLRHSPDGRLDRSYGEDGRAYVPSYSQVLVVASDGSSYVASSESSTLLKLTPSGSLDPSFGQEGQVEFPAGEAFDPGAMVILADGELLVAGGLTGRVGTSAAVLRYLPGGALDTSFGQGGVAVAKRRPPWTWEDTTAVAVDGRGAILVAGGQFRSCCTESGALVKFDSNGHVDRSFAHAGTRRVGRHIPAFYGLALRAGHIFTVATDRVERADRDSIYSFRYDGSLDRRFGHRGVAAVPARYTGHGNAEPEVVAPTSRRIFLVRSNSEEPLVAFSPGGKLQRNFGRRVRDITPRGPGDTDSTGPVAAFAGGHLLLAWTENWPGKDERGKEAELSVERLLLH